MTWEQAIAAKRAAIDRNDAAELTRLIRAEFKPQYIPAGMLEQKRWFAWAAVPDKNGKFGKVPHGRDDRPRHGRHGSPEDRAVMMTGEEAIAKWRREPEQWAGIGFAALGEGWSFVDLDGALEVTGDSFQYRDNRVAALARTTYTEVSPGGFGLRLIYEGTLPPGRSKGIEVYNSGQFLTLTGNPLVAHDQARPIAESTPAIAEMVHALRGQRGVGNARPTVDPDDFMAGYEPRLGLTVERMEDLLNQLDPDMGRDDWVRVGMALHHETEGDDTGFDIWNDWSSCGSKYPGDESLREQWDSFSRRAGPGRRQVTMASVIHMTKDPDLRMEPTPEPEPEAKLSAPRAALQGAVVSATPFLWRDPTTIPRRPWVFGRWLLRGTVACVVAPGGVGKSTLLAGLALSLVTGSPLLGKTVWGGRKRVWLWNLEDDLDELSRLIQAAAKLHGVAARDIEDRLFVDSAMNGSGLCTAMEFRGECKILEPVYEALTAELIARGIDVLIVDPFVSSHAVEENSNSQIDKVVKMWGRVAKAAGCVVVLAHHTSKAGSTEVNANSARGASALLNAARSALVINRMTAEIAGRFGIPEDQRRRYLTVGDDKHNRAPAEGADWFQLASVDLGNGTPENEGDSVAAAVPWTPPKATAGIGPADIAAVQRLVAEGGYRHSVQSSDWVGHAVGKVLGLAAHDLQDRPRINAIVSEWIDVGYLAVVVRPDAARKRRPFVIPEEFWSILNPTIWSNWSSEPHANQPFCSTFFTLRHCSTTPVERKLLHCATCTTLLRVGKWWWRTGESGAV